MKKMKNLVTKTTCVFADVIDICFLRLLLNLRIVNHIDLENYPFKEVFAIKSMLDLAGFSATYNFKYNNPKTVSIYLL